MCARFPSMTPALDPEVASWTGHAGPVQKEREIGGIHRAVLVEVGPLGERARRDRLRVSASEELS